MAGRGNADGKGEVSEGDELVERTTAERVVFTGGEPTLSERFLELVVHAKVKGLRVTVITNGNGDFAVYEGLARAGVDLMEFSVLSARAETHDGITGVKGAWERAMRSLRLMMERGVEVVPVTVVMERNAGEVAECVEYLHGMGLRRFMVNRYNIGGEGLNQAEEVSASQERLRETFREVDGLAGRLGLEVVSGVCTPHCLLDPKDYPHIRFGNCPTDVYRRPLTFGECADVQSFATGGRECVPAGVGGYPVFGLCVLVDGDAGGVLRGLRKMGGVPWRMPRGFRTDGRNAAGCRPGSGLRDERGMMNG